MNELQYDFSTPIYDQFNKPLIEKDPSLIDRVIENLNSLLNHNIILSKTKNTSEWIETFDIILEPLLNKIVELNITNFPINQALIILSSIVYTHEKVETLSEINLIGKLRIILNTNPELVILNLQESIALKKMIVKANIKSFIKDQLLSSLKSIEIENI